MKKSSLISLAIATVLAISPAAFAQTYNFTFTSPDNPITVAGTFTLALSPIGSSPLDYNFTTFNATIDNSNLGTSVAATLNPAGTDTAPGSYIYSPDGGYIVNNQFYPGQNATAGGISGAAYIDNYGLLLTDASGDEINFWGNGGGTYTLYDTTSSVWQSDQVNDLRLSVSVPEYGAMSMLLLSIVALAGGFFFKTRNSGMLMTA